MPFAAIFALSVAAVVAMADPAAFRHQQMPSASFLSISLAVNVLAAAVAQRACAVTRGGAVAGAATGFLLLAGGGWPAWSMLGCALGLTLISTRWKQARKARLGMAEARGGRRAAANVLANTGLGAALAVVAWSRPTEDGWPLALTAALAAAASDTVASEVGKAVGGRTWRLLPPAIVPAGVVGGVSLAGLAGNVGAGAVFAAVALATGVAASGADAAVIVIATVAAGLLEGVLAVVTEERGLLDNDGVNVLTSAMGAGLAGLMLAAR